MGSVAFLSFAITVFVLDTLKQQSIIPTTQLTQLMVFYLCNPFDILDKTISINARLKLSVTKYSKNQIYYTQLMQSVSKASLPEVLQQRSPTTPPNNNSNNRYHYNNNVLVKNLKMLRILKMKIGDNSEVQV